MVGYNATQSYNIHYYLGKSLTQVIVLELLVREVAELSDPGRVGLQRLLLAQCGQVVLLQRDQR